MNAPNSSGFSGRLLNTLNQPVDGATLALFRILIAALMLLHLAVDVPTDIRVLATTKLRFAYDGFAWLPVLPRSALNWHCGALALAALCVALGLFYRAASAVLTLGFGYLFLLEQSHYSNSSYWLLLATVLLALLPAQRVWALDVRRFGSGWSLPVPRWAPLSIVVFTAVPLLYMGFSRLTADWLAGYPFLLWFSAVARGHFLGPAFGAWLADGWPALAWSWFGLFVHLAVVPMLLWRRTRWFGIALFLAYYVGLSIALERFILPLPALAGMVAFFAADGPRRLFARFSRAGARPEDLRPVLGEALAWPDRLALPAVALLLAFHALFPARSLLYPGVAAWTGEGYRFAWRTMLDDKNCTLRFSVRNPETGASWNATPQADLRGAQLNELEVRPDMVLQFAHYLERSARSDKAVADPQVFARVNCSLNGRSKTALLDPEQDLTGVAPDTPASAWVTPFDPPPRR